MSVTATPKASLIITTHNRPCLVPRAVSSARASGTDIEIVVVDDASSDETAQVCERLSGIKYVRVARNQGVAGARNVGLLNSQGKYITFLDDDDTRLANSLDSQIEILETDSAIGLIYGQAMLGDLDGRPTNRSYPSECAQGDLFWKLVTSNFIPCGSAVFRRSCLNRVGVLNRAISGIDDWDLWVRIAEIYPIMALKSPVMIWRRSTPTSKQGTSDSAHLVSLGVMQFGRWMSLPRAVHATPKTRRDAWRNFSETMAEHLIWETARALGFGRVDRALWNLLTVPRLYPLSLMRIVKHRAFRVLRPAFRKLDTRNSYSVAAPSSEAVTESGSSNVYRD